MRRMVNFVVVAVGIYAAFVGTLFVLQRSMLYFPDSSVPSPHQSLVPEMKPVEVTTNDGLVMRSWYRAAEDGRPTVVLFHGNAGHIGHRAFKARVFMKAGFGMMLVGYRGYGGNPGKPTEEGLFEDARAALQFLDGQGGTPENVVLYGESLGSGVAVRMAAERAPVAPVGALILEAPYTSIADVAAHHYPYLPARLLVRDRYDSLAVIAKIRTPLLIIHGEVDRTIPTRFGRTLFAAAVEPKEAQWIENADHNGLFDFGAGALAVDFIERRLGGG
jgi:uncharacterized protein